MKKFLFVLFMIMMVCIFLSCSKKDVPPKRERILVKYSERLEEFLKKDIVLLSNKHDIDKEKLTDLLIILNYPKPEDIYFSSLFRVFDFSDVDTTLVLNHFDDYEDYFNNLSVNLEIDKEKLSSIILDFEIVSLMELGFLDNLLEHRTRSSEDSSY